jgi:putative ABC transport system permease protein
MGFRTVPLGWRMMSRDPLRFLVTLAGGGVSIALMLFLAAVYGGVETESNRYVARRPVSVWVSQTNATNLVRSSSLLSARRAEDLRNADGVVSVAPLLRLITTIRFGGKLYTAFVCGIDGSAAATRPEIVAGSGALGSHEIIVDLALARRAGLAVGDTVLVQGRSYRVSGISEGTNVVISQFTFVRIEDAEELFGFPGVVSFLLVQGRAGLSTEQIKSRVRAAAPGLNVFTADEFTANNLEELRSGLLPILATVALFGAVVGASVITLLLYGSVLERREEYAVVKAIGASRNFLRLLVLRQSLAAVICGYAIGLSLYFVARPVILRLVPVLAISLLPAAAIAIAAVTAVMGVAGALLPIAKLERVLPGEVFRA